MAALPLGVSPSSCPRPVSDVLSAGVCWRHAGLTADTLRGAKAWRLLDTGVTQDGARPRWGGQGHRVHGPSPRPVRPHWRAGQWLTVAGARWSAGLEVLRAAGGGSPVCELCVMWSKARTGAWEGGARVWSWEAWGLDKAHRQGEPLLEVGVPGRGSPASARSRTDWLGAPCQTVTTGGTWAGQRQQRAVPPILGHGCPHSLSTQGQAGPPLTWAVSSSFSITTEEQL